MRNSILLDQDRLLVPHLEDFPGPEQIAKPLFGKAQPVFYANKQDIPGWMD